MNENIVMKVFVCIDLAAGAIYACHGDIRLFIYWTAAAILTASAIY